MSRYPDETTRRFDQQFAETPEERNERLRTARDRRLVDALHRLVADLSVLLTDEGSTLTPAGLDILRRRVANALPPARGPEWLVPYRDPPVVQS